MYAAGNLPDHVTRYNHKDTNRWMVVCAERSRGNQDMIVTGLGLAMACVGLIVTAVFMLQMV